MYEDLFQFRRPPFAGTPDPRCLFAPPALQESIDELVLRLSAGQGVCVLTGPAGSGKSLICRVLAAELNPRFTTISIPVPGGLSPRALLQTLLFELGEPIHGFEEQELRLALIAAARERVRRDRPCVVLLDEAHRASHRVLDELRGLALLDEQASPLFRLLLTGQLALEETLVQPQFDALNQQIVAHKTLEAYSLTESVEFILHRVAWAGGDPAATFSIAALDLLVQASGGNPRCLCRLCDQSLILAAAAERLQVDQQDVAAALEDLRQLPLHWNEIPQARSNSPATEQDSNDWEHEDLSREVPGLDSGDSVDSGDTPEEFEPEDPDSDLDVDSAADAGQNDFILVEDDGLPTGTLGDEPFLPIPFEPAGVSDGVETEEVADPYAALDAERPSLSRTYDDRSLAEAWRGKCGPAGALPTPPEPPADLQFDRLPVVEQSPLSSPVVEPVSRIERVPAPASATVLTRRSEEARLLKPHGVSSDLEYDVVEPESPVMAPTRPANNPPVTSTKPAVSIAPVPSVATPSVAAADYLETGGTCDVHPAHPTPAPASARAAGMGRLFSTLRRKLGQAPLR